MVFFPVNGKVEVEPESNDEAQMLYSAFINSRYLGGYYFEDLESNGNFVLDTFEDAIDLADNLIDQNLGDELSNIAKEVYT